MQQQLLAMDNELEYLKKNKSYLNQLIFIDSNSEGTVRIFKKEQKLFKQNFC